MLTTSKTAFTLAEVFLPFFAGRRKSAFTLAEILVTLGIIGVVAAMTLPAVIGKYQKKQTAVQLKKAYSEISQLLELAQIDNDEIKYWDFSLTGKDFYLKYFKPYLKTINEIPNSEFRNFMVYKNLNGRLCSGEVWCTQGSSYYSYLSNGSVIGLMTHVNSNSVVYKAITIDVNGLKSPNQLGKDVFVFSISKTLNNVVPYGFHDAGVAGGVYGTGINRDIVKSNHQYGCNKTQKGIWCAALIYTDGWEIKDDYPW